MTFFLYFRFPEPIAIQLSHYLENQEPIAILDGKSGQKYQRFHYQSNSQTTFDAERKIFVQYQAKHVRSIVNHWISPSLDDVFEAWKINYVSNGINVQKH